MRVYNKLVRDNIPDICQSNGQTAYTSVLDDERYNIELRKKLSEEVQEYLDSREVEELADILEVAEALAACNGCTFEKLIEIKEKKAIKNGKFAKRLFLEKVDD